MQIINGIAEQELINRLIQGDHTAFNLLFQFYYPGLVVFASHIIMDRQKTEEIVQDFFVRLWINRKAIHQSESIKSYLFTSIRNKSLTLLKKREFDIKK